MAERPEYGVPPMPPKTIAVRDVQDTVWLRFAAEAKRRGVTTGTLLTRVLREWLAAHEGETVRLARKREPERPDG